MANITYEDVARLLQGQDFIRFNHETIDRHCSGASNSGRLEVQDNGISLFCWRCGRRRFFARPGSARARLSRRDRSEVLSEAPDHTWKHAWPGGSTELLDWPQDVRDWAIQVLSVRSVKESGMAWDATQERLWIPVHLDGVPVKWNGRGFGDEGPKYLTGALPDYKYHDPIGEDRSIILTEDIVGALRLSQDLETCAYPILGVSLPHQAAERLCRLTDHVVIWLDNDNAKVLKARRKLVKLFDSLGCRCTVYRGEYDPKREPHLTTGFGRGFLRQELRL